MHSSLFLCPEMTLALPCFESCNLGCPLPDPNQFSKTIGSTVARAGLSLGAGHDLAEPGQCRVVATLCTVQYIL